ncbi:MAG: hypothetical protein IPM07_22985 [Anaerolineales bacterium]|nr:hypothetical protein [Anaerolineales bacterium]
MVDLVGKDVEAGDAMLFGHFQRFGPGAQRAFVVRRVGQRAHGAVKGGEKACVMLRTRRRQLGNGGLAPGKDTKIAHTQRHKRLHTLDQRPVGEPEVKISRIKHELALSKTV